MAWTREEMAARAAKELRDGFYVNLGIGLPTLVANYVPEGVTVWLQSENGLLGIGPFPTESEVNADLINAGKQTVTTLPGSAIFFERGFLCHDSWRSHQPGHSGGHAGLREGGSRQLDDPRQDGQRDGRGHGPGGRRRPGGGAHGAHRQEKRRHGRLENPARLTLPLTGVGVVNEIVTDLCVFSVTIKGLEVRELAPGVTIEEVRAKTGCPVIA